MPFWEIIGLDNLPKRCFFMPFWEIMGLSEEKGTVPFSSLWVEGEEKGTVPFSSFWQDLGCLVLVKKGNIVA